MFSYLIVLSFILYAFTSCKSAIEKDTDEVLQISGENRAELEKVLSHYSHDSIDKRKFNAARFLIANMKWHNTEVIVNNTINKIENGIYCGIDSILYISAYENNMITKKGKTNANLNTSTSCIVKDCQSLTSTILIKIIDEKFNQWQNKKNCKDINYNNFCEYLLPYTSHVLPLLLPYQKKHLYNFLSNYKGSYELHEFIDSLEIFQKRYALTFARELRKLKYQSRYYLGCFDLAYNSTIAFKMIGVPATMEMNIGYKHYEGKHYYCSFLYKGHWYRYSPLTRREIDKEEDYIKKMGGMNLYRYMYSFQKNTPYAVKEKKEFIPIDFQSPCIKDVTNEVFKVVNLKFPINTGMNNKLAYLATFSRESIIGWKPVTWGIINEGIAIFKNVIPERLYVLLQYKNDGTPIFIGKPFYLNNESNICYLNDKPIKRNVVLLRKFPYKATLREKGMNLKKAIILGSNDSSFQDSDTIGKFPLHIIPYYQDVIFNKNNTIYQYYRIKNIDGEVLNIAELQLLTKNSYHYDNTQPATPLPICKPLKSNVQTNNIVQLLPQNSIGILQDKNPLTYENIKNFIDIQLKYPQYAIGIRFMPVNADNIIKPELTYLLYGWNGHKWQLEGKQKAQYNFLQFSLNVGRLYWLKVENDYIGGREESPFTIDEQGKIRFIYE